MTALILDSMQRLIPKGICSLLFDTLAQWNGSLRKRGQSGQALAHTNPLKRVPPHLCLRTNAFLSQFTPMAASDVAGAGSGSADALHSCAFAVRRRFVTGLTVK